MSNSITGLCRAIYGHSNALRMAREAAPGRDQGFWRDSVRTWALISRSCIDSIDFANRTQQWAREMAEARAARHEARLEEAFQETISRPYRSDRITPDEIDELARATQPRITIHEI